MRTQRSTRGQRAPRDRLDRSSQLGFYFALDALRRAQGDALGLLGLGPAECRYRIVASGRHWRLRDYGGGATRAPLLIVPAPIKRPYLWDLTPSVSAIRHCLRRGLHVHLLEWRPPADQNGDAGLATFADEAIGAAVATIRRPADGLAPVLMGHSLGGTLAAMFAALEPEKVERLVLLAAPLCFQPRVSQFRDAIVALAPPSLADLKVVPGSLLSQLSALASPETFVWSRLTDAVLSVADPLASQIHLRIERWALDEMPLPGPLLHEMLQWLYREDRFCRGRLRLRGRTIGPSTLCRPTFAVVNTADQIASPASVMPFVDAMAERDIRVIDYPGEVGVALQHLGVLVGRRAYATVWPEIFAWLEPAIGRSV